MNGADLAVLVVPFLDGSSNRVEAGTDLEDDSMIYWCIVCRISSVVFFQHSTVGYFINAVSICGMTVTFSGLQECHVRHVDVS